MIRPISYPRLLENRPCWWLWRQICCRHGLHLWDEVGGLDPYLHCDACETTLALEHGQVVNRDDAERYKKIVELLSIRSST